MSDNNTEIDDIRENFNNITFSNYQKSKVRKELNICIYKNKIENTLYWCAELVCSGHFLDIWDIIILYYTKYIYTINPKLVIYLSMRFDNFKSILMNGYTENILRLRNNRKIRNIFSEILLILCFSKKNQTFEPYKLDKREEFDLLNMSSRFKAPHIDYIKSIYQDEDPKELVIPVNEIIYSLESEDLLNVYHWFEWILEYENKMSKDKKNKTFICETRIYAPSGCQKDIIWIIWDIIFYYLKKTDYSIYNKLDKTTVKKQINLKSQIINSLYNLFTIKYNPAAKRRRKLLIYVAFKFILTNIDINTPIISSNIKQQVEIVLEKNDNIYQEIKKNEHSTNTGYLFKDVKKQNLEKTIEKLEKLESIDDQNYKDIPDNLHII